ncbi:MAG: Stage 0 sporulation protein A [Candidatus Thorarchaeota archaeon AB_25]|nr:MAG: Stage 0 sporulation protein A [Candidatus Thorarchaeota archaeon AB_25]
MIRGGEEMKIRVLVIDDDEDLLFLAGKFLTREDERIQLVSATTDQEALRLIEEEQFDAIVCDHFLGHDSMTGLELLEWTREFNPHIPFIIFTGRSQEAVAIRALNLGADYYLKKGTEEFRELFTQLANRIITEVEARRQEEALETALSELEKRVDERTAELTKTNEQLAQEIAEREKIEDSLLLQRDLGNTLCKTENLIDALDRILKATVHLEGVDTGGIFLVDDKTGQLDLSTSQGMSSQFLKSILGTEKSLEVTEPIYVSRSEITDPLKKLSDYEDLTAVAIVPVLFEDKTVAILSLGSHSHDEIPTTDKHTLEAIAIQVGAYMARVKAQQAIAQSQSEMMGMFDSFQDLFFIVDRTGLVLHANNTAYSKLGKDDATLHGKSILDLYGKENQRKITEILKSVKQGEVVKLDIPLIIADSIKIKANTRVVTGKYSGEDVVFMVCREV